MHSYPKCFKNFRLWSSDLYPLPVSFSSQRSSFPKVYFRPVNTKWHKGYQGKEARVRKANKGKKAEKCWGRETRRNPRRSPKEAFQKVFFHLYTCCFNIIRGGILSVYVYSSLKCLQDSSSEEKVCGTNHYESTLLQQGFHQRETGEEWMVLHL